MFVELSITIFDPVTLPAVTVIDPVVVPNATTVPPTVELIENLLPVVMALT